MTHDEQTPTSSDAASPRSLSDAEVRAIAERLVQEHRAGPPANPDQQLTAERHELSPADEERVDAVLANVMGLPSELTIRATREAGPHTDVHEALESQVAAHRLHFLETELSIGNTMLDAAAITQIPASRTRRVAAAWEAHDEVARSLARGDHPAFTAAEQEGLEAGLARLRSRLEEAG